MPSSTMVPPWDITTWTIVQGSQWGQFNDQNGNPVGTAYSARVADIAGLTFKFAPNVPDTVFCMIKASSNGIDRYKRIYPTNFKKPELVVTPPADINQFIAGTDLPKMPNPVVTAQLKNYNGGEVDFHWKLTIKWKAKGVDFSTPQDITEKYEGDAMGQNSDVVDLEVGQTLYGETDIRGGDDIMLTVTATTIADGKVYTNVSNPFIIKGQNPNVATLLAELHNHLYSGYTVDNYAAVVWDESRFNQFSTSDDFIKHPHSTTLEYPLMGGTGVGLMQIDPPPNDDIVWNWVANIQEGQRHFNLNIDAAKNYQNLAYFNYCSTTPDSLKNVPTSTDTTQNQVFLQAYCYYNGGSARYWDWVDPTFNKQGQTLEPGHWIKNRKSWNINGKGPVAHTNAVWSNFISNPKPWNE